MRQSCGGVSRAGDVSVSQSNKLIVNVPLIKRELVCKRKRPRGNSIITKYSVLTRTTNEFITPLGTVAGGADQQGREALYLALRLINSHGILKIWTGLGGS